MTLAGSPRRRIVRMRPALAGMPDLVHNAVHTGHVLRGAFLRPPAPVVAENATTMHDASFMTTSSIPRRHARPASKARA